MYSVKENEKKQTNVNPLKTFTQPFDFEKTLATFGLSPDQIKQNIEVKNEQAMLTTLGASIIHPVKLSTDQILKFKSLVGRNSTNWANTHWDLPKKMWSGRSITSAEELSAQERDDLELAYWNTVFGDAEVVSSYHAVLEQLHGKFDVAIYAVKRLVLGNRGVLSLSGEPALLIVDELVFDQGQLEITTIANVRINRLIKQ